MDCELIVSGFLHQPTNALSSMAFLVAAGCILIFAFRREGTTRTALLVLALAVAANGVGSFALHGPDPSWAQWAHDAAIMAVLLFIAVRAFGHILGVASRHTGGWLRDRSRRHRTGPCRHQRRVGSVRRHLGRAVLGEVTTLSGDRRTRRSEGLRRGALARKVGLAAIALGGVAYLLGQTGSPLCRPESLFQWHAIWHILVAVALVAYAHTLSHGRWPSPLDLTRRDA